MIQYLSDRTLCQADMGNSFLYLFEIFASVWRNNKKDLINQNIFIPGILQSMLMNIN
jgi:hypothetical protein